MNIEDIFNKLSGIITLLKIYALNNYNLNNLYLKYRFLAPSLLRFLSLDFEGNHVLLYMIFKPIL